MDSCDQDPSTPDPTVKLPLTSITQNNFSQTCQAGFILTKATGDTNGPYDGAPERAATAETDVLSGNIAELNNVVLTAGKITGTAITGYMIPVNATNSKNILNTTWTGTYVDWQALTTKVPFPVNIKSATAYIGQLDSDHKIKVASVEQFYDGFGDFPVQGTNFAARLSGHADGPFATTDGSNWQAVFTGFSVMCDDDNPTSYTKVACEGAGGVWRTDGLHIMALAAPHAGGDIDVTANAEIGGTVAMTNFLAPQGEFLHYEAFRLLPNFATGQPTTDAYPREHIKQGGAYPGMSSLNTMEVYLDITWSAPCAGVAGCVEQPA
jgi:hypothetical protein